VNVGKREGSLIDYEKAGQIGRIFAYWAIYILNFKQIFIIAKMAQKSEIAQICGLLFPTE
jgi:hypothetical protein